MKNILFFFIRKLRGKKRFQRFFLILKNIGIQGLNYQNADIENNGELFLIKKIATHFSVDKNTVVFDVGANIGNYSKALTENFHKRTSIYSFEPFSVPYKQLKEVEANFSNINTFQFGFSNKPETLPLFSSNEFSEVGGIYNRSESFDNIPLTNMENCVFKTIHTFCIEQNIQHIHFLKIDVEGHELAVLEGASSLITESKIDFIQFEFGAGNIYSRTYFADFFKLLSPNYKIYRLLVDGLEEIKTYHSEVEIQLLANYVAICKNTVANTFQ